MVGQHTERNRHPEKSLRTVSVKFEPFKYQHPMIEWMAERDFSCLFCSPGLGKTAVTLHELDRQITNGESRGALIVAPLRVANLTWPEQVEEWSHSSWMTVANMRTPEGQQAWEDASADIYVINYEQLASKTVTRTCPKCKGEGCTTCGNSGVKTTHHPGFVERFIKGRKTIPVDTIVWDELSLTKNPSSKRINAIRPFNDLFTKRIGLTGTPVPNNYLDLFAQVRLIDDGKRLGRSLTHYRDTHFQAADYMGYTYELKPGAKEKIDARLADLALVMLGDDYLDVPTCHAEDIEVTLPPKARTAYKTMEKELLLEIEDSEVVALTAATLTMKLVQITGGTVYDDEKETKVVHDAKIKAFKKLRKKHKDEPILLLTLFKHERARLLKEIPGAQMFDEAKMKDWQAGKIKTWIADFRSLSHGIDGLQKGGRIACWYSTPYSNEGYVQTNARLIRTGQSYETIIYRLIAKDTVDEAIVEALRTKDGEQQGLLHALKNLQRMRS